jgi:hypothetical protein
MERERKQREGEIREVREGWERENEIKKQGERVTE